MNLPSEIICQRFTGSKESTRLVKGPQARIHYDVRRIWRCPQCGNEKKSSIQTVSMRCSCQQGGAQMALVEQTRPPGDFAQFSLDEYIPAGPDSDQRQDDPTESNENESSLN